MKRTNLVLKEDLLETATRLLGARSYSSAVNQALEEVIRLVQIRQLSELVGQGVWEGSLSEMRGDRDANSSGQPRRQPRDLAMREQAGRPATGLPGDQRQRKSK